MYKSQGSGLSCLQGWMAARALALGDHAGRGGSSGVTRPHPPSLPPGPVVCEAFAWTPELIHIRLVDAAQSGAAVPRLPNFYSLSRVIQREHRKRPPSPFLPHGQLQGMHCCSLAASYRKARVKESRVSRALSPAPTLAKLPFLSLCPLLMMPGACFGKGTS